MSTDRFLIKGTARIYWQDNRLASIGLRPATVYGSGRDQGITSAPTKAMFAAIVGQPFHIPYGGRGEFQYADDVAKAFIRWLPAVRRCRHQQPRDRRHGAPAAL